METRDNLWIVVTTLAFAVLFTAACTSTGELVNQPAYWPTDRWLTADPMDHGMEVEQLGKVGEKAEAELPFLDSIIVIRNGYIVYEAYFNGYDENTLHDLASVTKSWTSAAVGVVRSQGMLIDLDAKLPELLPGYFQGRKYEDKAAISLEHLLTMRSGIEFDDELFSVGGYGGEELLGVDVTEFLLGFPVAHSPGEVWNYSTLDTQLISAVIEEAAGESLSSLVEKQLFDPIGITDYEWLQDAAGTSIGGAGLQLTPRDSAKLGFLYLHGGQWDGTQLVPAEWVKTSTTPQNSPAYYEPSGQVEQIEWYGYQWWTWKPDWYHGYRAFQAKGYGGQEVLVLPELNLILVATAHNEGLHPEVAGEQEDKIYALVYDLVLPALEEIES